MSILLKMYLLLCLYLINSLSLSLILSHSASYKTLFLKKIYTNKLVVWAGQWDSKVVKYPVVSNENT